VKAALKRLEALRGTVIIGDILAPLDEGMDWLMLTICDTNILLFWADRRDRLTAPSPGSAGKRTSTR